MKSKLEVFLGQNIAGKDETCNLVSLNGGRYFIKKEDYETFFKLLEDNLKKGKNIALAQRKPEGYSQLTFDFDFHYYDQEPKEKDLDEESDEESDEEYDTETICDVRDRVYDDEFIEYLIEEINGAIKQLIPEIEEENLIAFVLEKEDGEYEEEKSRYKDGLHLQYPLVQINYPAQHKLREMIMERIKDNEIIQGCSNPLKDIVDRSVIETGNWMMYGCAKPEKFPYLVTKVFNPELEELEVPESKLELIKTLCVWNQNEEIPVKIDLEKKNFKASGEINTELDDIMLGERDDISFKNVLETLEKESNNVDKETCRKLLSILSPERVDDYQDWLYIGAAIFNTNSDWLDLWKEWSSKSFKYDELKCEELWEKHYPRHSGNKITLGTIKYYAMSDNPEEYFSILSESKDTFIKLLNQGLSNTHTDISRIVYFLYQDIFKYSGKEWYHVENGLWKKLRDPSNIPLRQRLTALADTYLIYENIINKKLIALSSSDDENGRHMLEEKKKKLAKIYRSLKSNGVKKSIADECKDFFSDVEFESKLDDNNYLLGFNDGVYDLEHGVFRPYAPTDLVSMTVRYDFPTEIIQEKREEVMAMVSSIIPDQEMREFIWTFLASTLIGENKDEIFVNFEGDGGNGKGVLTSLHTEALGDYAGTLQKNYLTNQSSSQDQQNTMLACLIKKRYVQVNEPEGDKTLNLNLIKELTGRDSIQLRKAHSSEVETVCPKFTLTMLFNQLSRINNTKDGGFLRRFLAINFPNKFVKSNPNPASNIYLADTKLKDKIKNDEDFKKQYMLLLLEYAKIYVENNERLNVPEKIYKNSRRLLADQDPYELFIEDNLLITKGERDYLKLDDVWGRFKEHFTDSRPKERIPNKKTFKDNLVKTLETYDGVRYADSKNRYKSPEGGKTLANVFVGLKFLDDE